MSVARNDCSHYSISCELWPPISMPVFAFQILLIRRHGELILLRLKVSHATSLHELELINGPFLQSAGFALWLNPIELHARAISVGWKTMASSIFNRIHLLFKHVRLIEARIMRRSSEALQNWQSCEVLSASSPSIAVPVSRNQGVSAS